MKELAKGLAVSPGFFMIHFYSDTYNGFTAVLFQFTRVGKDCGAARLLVDLDRDPDLGESIGVFPGEFDLESRPEDKWFVVCHNRPFSKPIDLKRKPH